MLLVTHQQVSSIKESFGSKQIGVKTTPLFFTTHKCVATHTLRNIAQELKHYLRISENYDLRQTIAFIFSNRTIHQRLTALPQ
jgi:hypothetical protein